MINNRQAGRRRGRGGQRQQGGAPNGQGNGNRIDSRARGNANQLYEKYKTLARDSQMQGDRVNTEYYLQFADHYFRVLSENRPRFEEQQQRRGVNDAFDDEDGDFDGDGYDAPEQPPAQAQQPRYEQQPRHEGQPHEQQSRNERPRNDQRFEQPPRQEQPRRAREPREAREPAMNGHRLPDPGQSDDMPRAASQDEQRAPRVGAEDESRARRPRVRRERPAANGGSGTETDQMTLDAAILPPAIALVSGTEGEIDAAVPADAKPRRRRRVATPGEEAAIG